MHRGTLTGILLGLLSSEKENTPTNTAIATAAGNMIARDLRDMSSLPGQSTQEEYIIKNSMNGLAPGTTVAAPSPDSLTRDMVGEYVGVDGMDESRVIILIDGIHHSFHESFVKAI